MKVAESCDAIQNMRSSMTAKSRATNSFNPAATRVKPVMFEKKTANARDFFGLSDGFKRLFANDAKDTNMRVPIAGYGGHTRGDRSQNFFGKTWRECALQSKKIERKLMA
jgi:hypothetical protein